jgi:hypothetical protein
VWVPPASFTGLEEELKSDILEVVGKNKFSCMIKLLIRDHLGHPVECQNGSLRSKDQNLKTMLITMLTKRTLQNKLSIQSFAPFLMSRFETNQ